jgi:hypothetical protein
MFREIVYKKVKFVGNQGKNGSGAQERVLNEMKEGDKAIHIIHKTKGRLWASVKEEAVLSLIKKNISLFEVLATYPKKVYFDIDGEPDNTNLNEIKEIINENFPNNKMSISGYTSSSRHSYHIVLNNYLIRNDEELNQLKYVVKHFFSLNSAFDWKVYTKNRNMKAINQSKPKAEVQKIIEDDNEKNHLICSFIPADYLTLPPTLIQKQEVEHHKLKEARSSDYSKVPKMKLEVPAGLDLTKSINLLKITPISKEFDHNHSHKVARFCYHNGLTFDDFKSWYMNKSTDTATISKWVYHWKNLSQFAQITKHQFMCYLKLFYPKLDTQKAIDFFGNWDIPQDSIKKIDSLDVSHFNTDKKCLIVNIGMGGGKTTQTINELKNASDFCWITPNISLAHNTFTRLKNENVICNIYDSAKNKKAKADLIENSQSILICLNSLFYIKKSYEVIVIDEIETYLKLFHNNETIKSLNEVWKNFVELLKNAKKLILLDAFVSNLTINFLNSLDIEYEIIQRNEEVNPRQAIIKPNFKHWVYDIVEELKQNKKLIIFYPYKNQRRNLPSMKTLCDTLSKMTNKKGIFHNADASDKNNKKLKDVNKHWVDYDFVISNNKINVGLNFDLSHFDTAFLSIASFNAPRDVIQFSYRARELKSQTVKYCYLEKFNSFEGGEVVNVSHYDDVYQKLFIDVMKERSAPLTGSFEFFLQKAGYSITNETIEEKLTSEIEFPDNDFYGFGSIADYEKEAIEDMENAIYCGKASTLDKLTVKKHYFRKKFKEGTPEEVMAELWDGNKFNFIENVRKVLYTDSILSKLKNNYGWSLYFPDQIDKDFKFSKEDLEMVFSNFNFASLTEKSKHHLILKSYINTVYGIRVIESKCDKSKKNYTYAINDKARNAFIMVKEHIKPIYQKEEIDFIDEE